MAQKKKKRARGALPVYIWIILAAGIAAAVGAYFLDSFIGSRAAFDYSRTHESDSKIRISEVMTSNQSATYTASGDASDWFELENTGLESVNLKGYQVRLASDVTAIYALPAITLKPGACAVVYCDNVTSS
ncbi:MAG: lamin tail domain-containing protein, partial [Candidatus Hydrogenedens sp.]|nr:lamin tail domain-containing protein [Candidatus Hydrogenedens sp.]